MDLGTKISENRTMQGSGRGELEEYYLGSSPLRFWVESRGIYAVVQQTSWTATALLCPGGVTVSLNNWYV